MRGVVIINGYPNGEKFYRQGERIAKALQDCGLQTDVLKNGEVYAVMQEDGTMCENILKKYDFAVYLDKDKYLSRGLELQGLRLFNSASAVEICDDKMLTYLALQNCGVRLIKTIPAPLCYTPNVKPSEEFLQTVARELGFPLVAKKSYGSFGKGVYLVHGMDELRKIAQKWIYEPHFFQEFVRESAGHDVRVIVIGGKALGGMERVAQEGEFRSNVELGGTGKKIQLEKEYAQVAETVAKVLGLDYCGVDLLQTSAGPVVCEVNSNAFFEGFEEALGVDVAMVYAKHIFSVLTALQKSDL